MRISIIFRIIILLLGLGGALYAIHYLKTKGINPAYLFLNPEASKAFLPQDVSHFEWQSSSKIFVFDKDKKSNWAPQKNQKTLQGIIEFLSEIQLKDVQQTGKPALSVVLTVSGVKWMGTWDGLSFVWKEGPQKGHGEILSDKKNLVFFRGKFILDDVAIDFCPSRAQEILLQIDGANYDLTTSGRDWYAKGSQSSLDSIAIEKWLTQFCKMRIRAVIDPSYIQSKTTSSAITIRDVSGQQVNMTRVDGDLFLVNGYGLLLGGLKNSLDELKKGLPKSTNP